jgi:endonuclease/exonuclease/phosphatase family metal-dependent hydrolase
MSPDGMSPRVPNTAASRPPLTAFQRSLDLRRIYLKGHIQRPPKGDRLRILSWNIERGHSPDRLAEAFFALQPDVACLQEVDWGNERTGFADVLEHLTAATGMLGIYGIEFFELPSRRRRARFAGGGVTGNALLTRIDPVSAYRIELPKCLDWEKNPCNEPLPRRIKRALQNEPRLGGRFGLGAMFRFGGSNLYVCSLHLEDKSGGVAGRWSQYKAAIEAIGAMAGRKAPVIIAGDFNTFDSRLARLMVPAAANAACGKPASVTEAAWWRSALLPETGYTDPFPAGAWTFAASPLFRVKLDWITMRGCEVLDLGVAPFSSSDHRPLWADFCLPNA